MMRNDDLPSFLPCFRTPFLAFFLLPSFLPSFLPSLGGDFANKRCSKQQLSLEPEANRHKAAKPRSREGKEPAFTKPETNNK